MIYGLSTSQSARLARLNRRLRRDDMKVRKCRGSARYYYDYGDFFVVDFRLGCVVAKDIDLVEWDEKYAHMKLR